MEVVITADAREAGRLGADIVSALIRKRPDAVLGLATGSSPVVIYDELGRRVREGELSLRQARAFILDEYLGLPQEHPEAYRNVIHRDFVSKVDIDPSNVHSPTVFGDDVPAACAAYEAAIAAAGGIDVQYLGLGTDGHIAFNEPSSSLASRTRVKALTPQTRADNARFFGGDLDGVPTHAVTQGVATIMEARHLVLIASGESKAEAIRHVVEGAVSASWPATMLQMHPHVTVFLDPGSASLLERRQYYEYTFTTKPGWQGL